MKLLNS